MRSSQVQMLDAALQLREARNKQISDELKGATVQYHLEYQYPKSTPRSSRNWGLVGGLIFTAIMGPFVLIILLTMVDMVLFNMWTLIVMLITIVLSFIAGFVIMKWSNGLFMRMERDFSIIHMTEKRFVLVYTNISGLPLEESNSHTPEMERQFFPWAIDDIRRFRVSYLDFVVRDWLERKDLICLRMGHRGDVFKNKEFNSGFFIPRTDIRAFLQKLLSLNKNIILSSELRRMINI